MNTSPTTKAVTSHLNYLSPDSSNFARYIVPGREVNTAAYQPYEVQINDARSIRDEFTLERNGFELIDHISAVPDFTDRDALATTYTAEVEAFIAERLGATRVVSIGPVLRRTDDLDDGSSQPVAGDVHVDYSPSASPQRYADLYAKVAPDGPGFHRALSTSLWRVFSTPPQDWPLTLCDALSVEEDEGVRTPLIWPGEIPEDPVEALADYDLDTAPAGTGFYYRPEHRWWYFSNMHRDEVLLFKLHDSDTSDAWRCVHSAFRNPEVNTGIPRHSVEFRTVAFFE